MKYKTFVLKLVCISFVVEIYLPSNFNQIFYTLALFKQHILKNIMMKEKPFLYCKSQPLQTATAMNTLHYCIFYYFFIQPFYKYFRLTEKILVSQSLVFTIQHPSNCKLFKTFDLVYIFQHMEKPEPFIALSKRGFGSAVLKESKVECRSIPLIGS